MTPTIGQRWKHTHHRNGTIFIAEVVGQDPDGKYKMHVIQNISNITSDYSSHLQTNDMWAWEYLPGQDNPA